MLTEELHNLRKVMKEEIFQGRGLSDQMKKSIFKNIQDSKSRNTIRSRKMLPSVLTVLFMVVCLSFFVYLGVNNFGLVKQEADNSSKLFEWKVTKPKELSGDVKLPAKLPFRYKDIVVKENPGFNDCFVNIKGDQSEVLSIMVIENYGRISTRTTGMERVKIGDYIGYYELKSEYKNMSIHWEDEENHVAYDMLYHYKDNKISKEDFIKVAESFR